MKKLLILLLVLNITGCNSQKKRRSKQEMIKKIQQLLSLKKLGMLKKNMMTLAILLSMILFTLGHTHMVGVILFR